jgi:SpoVK/Ycf46/Vps4 family AAA+-type ATPase
MPRLGPVVVSKWVVETEQHLEGSFQEADDGHCGIFFDECDALFGKRGDVQHGVDPMPYPAWT